MTVVRAAVVVFAIIAFVWLFNKGDKVFLIILGTASFLLVAWAARYFGFADVSTQILLSVQWVLNSFSRLLMYLWNA